MRTGTWLCKLNGHQGDVCGVDANPDGHHLASGADDGLVMIWRYEEAA